MTEYAAAHVHDLQTLLATVEHTVTVFEQVSREMRVRGLADPLDDIQARLQRLRATITLLQESVQRAVIEDSKHRVRQRERVPERKPIHRTLARRAPQVSRMLRPPAVPSLRPAQLPVVLLRQEP